MGSEPLVQDHSRRSGLYHTYTEIGQSYLVNLTVENSAGVTASATNTIKTLSLVRSKTQTTALWYEGERVKSASLPMSPTVLTVVGWDFDGDGQIDEPIEGGLDSPCYVYEEELATMLSPCSSGVVKSNHRVCTSQACKL